MFVAVVVVEVVVELQWKLESAKFEFDLQRSTMTKGLALAPVQPQLRWPKGQGRQSKRRYEDVRVDSQVVDMVVREIVHAPVLLFEDEAVREVQG